jgi:Protein of unknown function (DUF3465)
VIGRSRAREHRLCAAGRPLPVVAGAAFAVAAWLPCLAHSPAWPPQREYAVAAAAPACDSATQLRPGARVETTAVVEKVLKDDRSGSRHQRFIVKLPSGQTLLISHNIDIAPRVEGLARGDTVSFSGIYEPNSKGGVVHWTHHDPSGRHAAGWIEHHGHRYQ